MKAPPKWAQDLTINALIYLDSEGIKLNVPTLDWKHSNRDSSSGACWFKSARIVVRAGSDRVDAKMVLLHEIAHLQGKGHTDRFWDIAWMLYRWAKLPIRYCKEREGDYMKGALVAYRRSIRKGY